MKYISNDAIALLTVGCLLLALAGMAWVAERRVVGNYLDALGRILAGETTTHSENSGARR